MEECVDFEVDVSHLCDFLQRIESAKREVFQRLAVLKKAVRGMLRVRDIDDREPIGGVC